MTVTGMAAVEPALQAWGSGKCEGGAACRRVPRAEEGILRRVENPKPLPARRSLLGQDLGQSPV